MTDKVCSLLGFASKAGALRFGFENSVETVKKQSAKCVLYAFDISDKSRKEVLFFCNKFGVKAFELKKLSIEDLSKCIGKRCGVVAVLADTFSSPIISHLTSESGREEN